jgi:hypothetical protein
MDTNNIIQLPSPKWLREVCHTPEQLPQGFKCQILPLITHKKRKKIKLKNKLDITIE